MLFQGYEVKQLSFSVITSILTFDFDLIFGSFFGEPYWAIFGGALLCYFLALSMFQKLFCGLLM